MLTPDPPGKEEVKKFVFIWIWDGGKVSNQHIHLIELLNYKKIADILRNQNTFFETITKFQSYGCFRNFFHLQLKSSLIEYFQHCTTTLDIPLHWN